MSFDISKYCHIGDVVHHKGGQALQYDHNGLNLFLVAKGNCTADSHGTVLNVKKEEIICCEGRINIRPESDCEIYGFNISGIIREKYSREVGTAFITSSIFAPFLPLSIFLPDC